MPLRSVRAARGNTKRLTGRLREKVVFASLRDRLSEDFESADCVHADVYDGDVKTGLAQGSIKWNDLTENDPNG